MNIDRIRKNIVGDYGLATSNQYHISFEFRPVGEGVESLLDYMATRGFSFDGNSNPQVYGSNDEAPSNAMKLSFLADEVNIPGYSIATGDFKGPVPGINVRYAHTRNFTEFNAAFLMDMDHTPLKFFRLWSDYIAGLETVGFDDSTRYSQVQYYNFYAHDIIIDKLEPNTSRITKQFAKSSYDTHNVVTRTRLYRAFPYMINDLTASNGPNQPMRLQTTFYYEYYTTENFNNNIRLRDPSLGLNDLLPGPGQPPTTIFNPNPSFNA